MNANIYQQLQHLTPAEKYALGEALIDGAETQALSLPLTDGQRLELQRRLAHHRAHPHEPGVTLFHLAEQLLSQKH
jgi:putative addiction module component (TIGR02574 family)